jgi:hypothetical protein
LAAPWEEHLAFWHGESDRGIYNDVSVISDYLVERYEAGDLSEFPPAFAVLERCLVEGDVETRDVATISILEGVQTVASHRPFGTQVFEQWLQPRSRLAWLVGAAAWRCEFALADVLRGQLGSAGQGLSMPDLTGVQSAEIRDMVERLYPR